MRSIWLLCEEYLVTLWGVFGYFVRSIWLLCEEYLVTLWGVFGYFVRSIWLLCEEYLVTLWGVFDYFVRRKLITLWGENWRHSIQKPFVVETWSLCWERDCINKKTPDSDFFFEVLVSKIWEFWFWILKWKKRWSLTFNLRTFWCLANIATSSRMKWNCWRKIGSENFESLRKTVKHRFENILLNLEERPNSEILKNVQNFNGSWI